MKKVLTLSILTVLVVIIWATGLIERMLPTEVRVTVVNASKNSIKKLYIEYCGEGFSIKELSPRQEVVLVNKGFCYSEGGINFFQLEENRQNPKGTCLYIDGMKNIHATIRIEKLPIKGSYCKTKRISKI